MPVEFGRIYFDTQPLTQSQWPRVSTSLENAFKLSRLFEVDLCIPRAVLDERQAQWFRELEDKERELERFRRSLARYCKGFCEAPGLGKLDRKKIEQAYTAQVEANLKQYEITTVETTSRLAEELYRLALRRVPPFGDKGTGFKDAVILFSIIDHLSAHPIDKPAVIVTKDSDFDEQALDDLVGGFEGALKIYRSLDDVTQDLDSALAEVMRDLWQQDRENAKAALEASSDVIAAFISESVPFTEYDTGGWGRIVEIADLQVRLIRDVVTPFPLRRAEDEPVTFSAIIEVGLQAVYEASPAPVPRRLRVGEPETVGRQLASVMTFAQGRHRETREILKVVELECRATEVDSRYQDIELLSAHRRDDLFSQLEMQMSLLRFGMRQGREIQEDQISSDE